MEIVASLQATLQLLKDERSALKREYEDKLIGLNDEIALIESAMRRRAGTRARLELEQPTYEPSGRIEAAVYAYLLRNAEQKVVEIARALIAQGHGDNDRSMQNMVSRALRDNPLFTRNQVRRWSVVPACDRPHAVMEITHRFQEFGG